jgi:hypothetical protein
VCELSYLYVCVYVCMCVCVSVRARERERDRERVSDLSVVNSMSFVKWIAECGNYTTQYYCD